MVLMNATHTKEICARNSDTFQLEISVEKVLWFGDHLALQDWLTCLCVHKHEQHGLPGCYKISSSPVSNVFQALDLLYNNIIHSGVTLKIQILWRIFGQFSYVRFMPMTVSSRPSKTADLPLLKRKAKYTIVPLKQYSWTNNLGY
uniref:Ovule protein n=1 Tax=Heterorhabditis bacteriophora TaxID=37862 RepID=A0A1I7WR62_HETBA